MSDLANSSSHGTNKYLDSLYRQLRNIVIERVNSSGKGETASRAMVSQVELGNEPNFWTVESRLVDSLGTISRDLGRELSLNEFLGVLAPDLTELRYSPIIPDAHLFAQALLRSHKASRVVFSRAHQQTAIQWTPRLPADDNLWIDLNQLCSQSLIRAINRDIAQSNRLQGDAFDAFLDFNEVRSVVCIAIETSEVVGDDDRVQIVTNRIARIIQKGSECEDLWKVFCKTIRCAIALENAPRLVLQLMQLGERFLTIATKRGAVNDRAWRELYSKICESLIKHGVPNELPEDLSAISRFESFDASSYWRDWSKSGRQGE